MIAHAFSTGSALLPGSGSEPAITRLANGRLANAQLRLSDGQKADHRARRARTRRARLPVYLVTEDG